MQGARAYRSREEGWTAPSERAQGFPSILTDVSWVFNLEATGVLNTNDIDPSKISNDITDISHLYYFSMSAGITYRF